MNQNSDKVARSTERSTDRPAERPADQSPDRPPDRRDRNGHRRAYAALVGSAALAMSLGAGVAPAYAAAPLHLNSAECDPLSVSGAYYVECFAIATGGTAPYTYLWSGSSVGQATGDPVRFGCIPDHAVSVSVTVTDAAGDVVYGGDTVECGGSPE